MLSSAAPFAKKLVRQPSASFHNSKQNSGRNCFSLFPASSAMSARNSMQAYYYEQTLAGKECPIINQTAGQSPTGCRMLPSRAVFCNQKQLCQIMPYGSVIPEPCPAAGNLLPETVILISSLQIR